MPAITAQYPQTGRSEEINSFVGLFKAGERALIIPKEFSQLEKQQYNSCNKCGSGEPKGNTTLLRPACFYLLPEYNFRFDCLFFVWSTEPLSPSCWEQTEPLNTAPRPGPAPAACPAEDSARMLGANAAFQHGFQLPRGAPSLPPHPRLPLYWSHDVRTCYLLSALSPVKLAHQSH